MKHKELTALMGQVVVVSSVLERTTTGEGHNELTTWKPESIEPRAGWVTGIRYLQQGRYVPSGRSYTGSFYEEGEMPYFTQTGKPIPALMVVFWPTMKAVPVPLTHYRLATPEDPQPSFKHGEFPDAYRDSLRQEMANWPRDASGRWKKVTAS